jgi:hypothetical protein
VRSINWKSATAGRRIAIGGRRLSARSTSRPALAPVRNRASAKPAVAAKGSASKVETAAAAKLVAAARQNPSATSSFP